MMASIAGIVARRIWFWTTTINHGCTDLGNRFSLQPSELFLLLRSGRQFITRKCYAVSGKRKRFPGFERHCHYFIEEEV